MAGTVFTPVEMANLALSHLKEPAIKAIDTSSVAGRWFAKNYRAKLDAFLALHEWDFAIELDSLPALVEKPPFRWEYAYSKPADCLRVPVQTEGGGRNGRLVELEVIGGKIMTDCPPPFQLRYIRRVDQEAEFSPLFVDGFAYFLAAGAAHVIAGKNSLVQTLSQLAEDALSEARMVDAMQSTPQPFIDRSIIEDR